MGNGWVAPNCVVGIVYVATLHYEFSLYGVRFAHRRKLDAVMVSGQVAAPHQVEEIGILHRSKVLKAIIALK
jgi:hypothetical protein